MAHVSLDLVCGVSAIGEGGYAVHVVAPEGVDERLDRLESATVKDEIALDRVDW